ncbi:MAG: recombination mediator RecR [Patescibacteria group bacterium]
MYSQSIQRLIGAFSRFPAVGPRTASRFTFHLLKADKKEAEDLMAAIGELHEKVRLCRFCFNPFDETPQKKGFCALCLDETRDRSLLCIVEKESDLEALERTLRYRGLYFILGGTVGMLQTEDLSRLRLKELKARLQDIGPKIRLREIILATNPTTEGEATALYLERFLKPFSVPTTRLGRGLPLGGELEYADEETLKSALEGRR